MFAEWSDPYNVDEYYNEVDTLYKNVPSLPSASQFSKNESSNLVKDTFDIGEIKPNDILPDSHSIGSQPKKNILQSGPIEGFVSYINDSDNLWIILIVIFMVLYILALRFQLETCKSTIQMFMLMNSHKIDKNL
jgi:hypothetical protein